jgi:cytidine deaminase
MQKKKCPVCDYDIETGIEVETAAGTVVVCCEECAVTAAKAEQQEGER